MTHRGSCECGAVTYAIEGVDLAVYACHCLNCQTRSGSAFAEHAMVPVPSFRHDGDTVVYERAVGGIAFEEVFCAACLTRLFNRNSALPSMVFLRAGTLADSGGLRPIAHIWTDRKQAWVVLPDGVPTFARSPTPEAFGAAVRAAGERGDGGAPP